MGLSMGTGVIRICKHGEISVADFGGQKHKEGPCPCQVRPEALRKKSRNLKIFQSLP
jgi:hypothetical protein